MPKMPKPGERLGDAPVEPQYREQMNELAQFIDHYFNGDATGDAKKVGFCFMVFDFGDGPGRCNYISNANRADVVTLLKEQLARFAGDTSPRSYTAPKVRAVLDQLTTELVDSGKLIEAGFVALRMAAIPPDAPPVQVAEMRKAFFAGAQHLFSSVFSFLEPGEEPTEKDLARLDQVEKELAQFASELAAEIGPAPKGTS